MTYTLSWAADSTNQRLRLKAECDRLQQEVALLREEIRIKDARMAQIHPKRRPHYPPTERMAILELRATRGWSLEQAAKVFLVTADTIASWVRRIEEAGAQALVQTLQPVNRFPDCVRHLVQRLKALCPALGKLKIVQVLCRAGLHLDTTTVGRMLKEPPHPKPAEKQAAAPQSAQEESQAGKVSAEAAQRVLTAKRINHLWHVDLTLVPTALGFWTSWLPGSLPQRWPFACWVARLMDHFSRRAMGFAVFRDEPDSRQVRSFLGRVIHQAQAKPEYLICDQARQFWCRGFKAWCRRQEIRPRFGAVGQHGGTPTAKTRRPIRPIARRGPRDGRAWPWPRPRARQPASARSRPGTEPRPTRCPLNGSRRAGPGRTSRAARTFSECRPLRPQCSRRTRPRTSQAPP